MQGTVRRVAAALLTLIALTLLLSSALAARSAEVLPNAQALNAPARAASATDAALLKMSPDLRQVALAAAAGRVGADAKSAETTSADVHLVFVLIRPGTSVGKYMTSHVVSRQLGELQWVTGEVTSANLLKLASVEGVDSVTSTEAFQPLPAPGLEEMTGGAPLLNRRQVAELFASGGKAAVLREMKSGLEIEFARKDPVFIAPLDSDAPQAPADVKVVDIHRATEAHAAGYTGEGVIAAVVDTGVDFVGVDMQGTQARVKG